MMCLIIWPFCSKSTSHIIFIFKTWLNLFLTLPNSCSTLNLSCIIAYYKYLNPLSCLKFIFKVICRYYLLINLLHNNFPHFFLFTLFYSITPRLFHFILVIYNFNRHRNRHIFSLHYKFPWLISYTLLRNRNTL